MAIEIKFFLDGIDRGQPLNAEDFGINITEESTINTRVVSFENELTFGGAVYDYLYSKVKDGEYCNLVTVSVLYECKAGWKKLVDGYLIVTECKFDIDKCIVRTNMYDETFSTKINNNKTIPFYSDSNVSKNLQPVVPPVMIPMFMFNPQDCDYNAYRVCITVYDAFKHLVNCMSDGLVEFESDYFQINRPDTSILCDTRTYLFITSGLVLRTNAASLHVNLDFESLFTALNRKLRLGMGFEKAPNGKSILRIEKAEYFFQQNRSAELPDQPNIEMLYDRQQLIASIKFGADPFLEKFECDNGDTPCSFLQTPFRGFKKETFGIIGTCNTERQLDLESGEIIFDTNLIEDIFIHGNEKHDDSVVIITACINRGTTISNCRALKYDPLGDGSCIYNGNLINARVAENWIGGYPNSLYQYLQGFDPADTIFNARYSGFPIQQFDIIEDTFTSYLQWTGDFLRFDTVLANANSNYNTIDTYVVPYAGIYTFTAGVTLNGINEPVGRRSILRIKQYNSNEDFLQDRDTGVISDLGYNTVIRISDTWTFACNQGDLIRIDILCCTQNPFTQTSWQQDIITEVTVDGITEFTEFFGDGKPYGDTGLQPVDPNEVLNILYKFKRPLTMEQIESILSNTSAPIGLGILENASANIDTYIRAIQIESIIRQNATFEMRSNKLLK